MTHDEAEALRSRDEHWTLHLIYACHEDPRVIVRSRLPIGWTWNFGHRFVLPTLVAFILIAIGPAALLWATGVRDGLILFAVTTVCVLVLAAIAHYIAAGPR
jgi:hypothetical protein